jgi:predicted Zn-dependent peptidase
MLQAILQNYIRRGGLLAASRLEALGVRMSLVVQPDFFGIQAVVLSPELSGGIWELLRWLRAPEIEEVDIERARAELLRRVTLEPTDKMIESAKKAVYGDHPYGFSLDQIRNNVAALSADSVVAWKAKYLDKVNPHILALGDVQGTAFISDLVSELSDRRYRVGTASEEDVPVPDDPTSSFKVISNADLGKAIMVYPGPEEGSDFAEMLDVALELLGSPNGLLTTVLSKERRLVDRLRLLRESGVGGGAIFIEVTAPPSNLEESVKEIRQQLNRFSEKSVSEPLFLDSLVIRLSEHHFRRQVRADYLLEIMRSVLAEEPTDYGERYILNVRQLRIGEIVFAVQRYMGEMQ